MPTRKRKKRFYQKKVIEKTTQNRKRIESENVRLSIMGCDSHRWFEDEGFFVRMDPDVRKIQQTDKDFNKYWKPYLI